uniref:ARAD1C09878p n=1 Tax=Blastobotrys adeninivorans TaxID=409370 RepID=A0A060T045_BLAAD
MTKALVFKQVPKGFPVAGQDLAVEEVPFDANADAPANGIVAKLLYASFDPYMRGRMRPAEVKSYSPAFDLGKPITTHAVAKVIKSNNSNYKPDDVVVGMFPLQEQVALPEQFNPYFRKLENPLGLDLSLFIGALGMPGQTAYSSLYEIGKPKKGETIFVSSAAGAVGQLVGQLAKHEGLRVIGSVGSQEKLDFITKTLGFDGGFNYKTEKPLDALKRLCPNGIDIYYDNVGGEQLEAALALMNEQGRLVECGMISQYNNTPDKMYGIKNLFLVVTKRLKIEGFIVGDERFGPKWGDEHMKNVSKWIKEGTFTAQQHVTKGIDNAAEGLIGIFKGENFGKAVLEL